MRSISKFVKAPCDVKREMISRKLWMPIVSKFEWGGGLGSNSLIMKPIMLHGKKMSRIGNNVTIRKGARIEVFGENSDSEKLIIGDNVTAEENLHIACNEHILIDHDVTISFDVMIMDCSHGYRSINVKALDQELVTNPVSIGAYSFIGAGAKIMPGVTIGSNCIIGANAVVNKNIPDNSIAVGVPARVIKKYNHDSRLWERV